MAAVFDGKLSLLATKEYPVEYQDRCRELSYDLTATRMKWKAAAFPRRPLLALVDHGHFSPSL
jgi:hypothetical protein